jgi:glycosyltransferase involved in cell wall biosynthesis
MDARQNSALFCSKSESGRQLADALRYCRGKVVCFLDDDDTYLPNELETAASAFVKK